MAASMDLQQTQLYWHFSVAGDLDYPQCSEFRMSIHRILVSGPRAAVVDLSRVEYLDSSGLGVLLGMSREYASMGGRVVLVSNTTRGPVAVLSRGLTGCSARLSSLEEAVEMLTEQCGASTRRRLLSGRTRSYVTRGH